MTTQAALRSIHDAFPYVRCFHSVEGWGMHMLASMDPIAVPPPEQLLAQLPASASTDWLEWSDTRDLSAYVAQVVLREVPVEQSLNPDAAIQITDDHPLNEYFLLRQMGLFEYLTSLRCRHIRRRTWRAGGQTATRRKAVCAGIVC